MTSIVETFAAKAFVHRAVKSPEKIQSVLDFFFGVETSTDAGRAALREGSDINASMQKLWYGGGPAYDQLCQAFTTTVRAAGKRELHGDWQTSVDGKMAQLLLVDQLARNIFRGSTEAFAYEDVSVGLARELADISFGNKGPIGEVYPPYMSFIAVGLMHSEALDDQVMCRDLLKDAKQKHPKLTQLWDYQLTFADDHRAVVEKFGRYPHRNKAKGRDSTAQEEAWLADTENLPGWAKSQVSK